MHIQNTNEAMMHFKSVDPILHDYLTSIDFPKREIHSDYQMAVIRSVIYQQVSNKAGDAVYARVKEVTDFTPENILEIDTEVFRNCGLSYRKTEYIKSIASHIKSGLVHFNDIDKMSNQEVIDMLVQIKGIGVWSAEMFLIFSLARMDVSSYGDLAIKRGYQMLYQLDEFPTLEQFEQSTKLWSPYNTIAMIALWAASVDKNLKG